MSLSTRFEIISSARIEYLIVDQDPTGLFKELQTGEVSIRSHIYLISSVWEIHPADTLSKTIPKPKTKCQISLKQIVNRLLAKRGFKIAVIFHLQPHLALSQEKKLNTPLEQIVSMNLSDAE